MIVLSIIKTMAIGLLLGWVVSSSLSLLYSITGSLFFTVHEYLNRKLHG